MNICIWGNELCAWVTAGVLAQTGNHVFLPGNSLPKFAFSEPNLSELLNAQIDQKRIEITLDDKIFGAEIHFLTVGCIEFAPGGLCATLKG